MGLTQTQLDFREGMSRMGAAVNLITSDGSAGKHGLVASSVCSVTDSPPTLLVCINRNAYAHDKILTNGVISVNVLAAHHKELSNVFSHFVEGVDRFSFGSWTILATGSPILKDANASLDCQISSVFKQGSHSVLFCEVMSIQMRDQIDAGLFYFSRDYHQIAPNS